MKLGAVCWFNKRRMRKRAGKRCLPACQTCAKLLTMPIIQPSQPVTPVVWVRAGQVLLAPGRSASCAARDVACYRIDQQGVCVNPPSGPSGDFRTRWVWSGRSNHGSRYWWSITGGRDRRQCKHVRYPALAEADDFRIGLGLSIEQRKRAGRSRTIDYHRPFRPMSRRPTK